MRKKDMLSERLQSAYRLRQIRESANLTQEHFAEILGISVSAYKKVESGENQISVSCLRNLQREMNISSDFILFGKNPDMNEAWKCILNCTEVDKLFILLRLITYFSKMKPPVFPLKLENLENDKEILHIIRELQNMENLDATQDFDNRG